MPTPTYTPLGSFTATTDTTSITFTSIGSYRDYLIQGNTVKGGTGYWAVRFNGDTTSVNPLIYAFSYVDAPAGITGTATVTGQTYAGNLGGAITTVVAQILDASATNKHKTIIGRWSNQGRPEVGMSAGVWPSTAAVTSIMVLNPGSTFSSGTTLSLYGIVS
jgi:hypothetical protein